MQSPSKITKNSSQGIIFVIVSCQSVHHSLACLLFSMQLQAAMLRANLEVLDTHNAAVVTASLCRPTLTEHAWASEPRLACIGHLLCLASLSELGGSR